MSGTKSSLSGLLTQKRLPRFKVLGTEFNLGVWA